MIYAQHKNGTFAPAVKPTNHVKRVFEKAVAGFGGCLVWTAATSRQGYGVVRHNGRQGNAHKAAYELINGPVPAGMQLDHLCHTRDTACPGGRDCRHRLCINPYHLEPVTGAENVRRSHRVYDRLTHCAEGHPYDEANTYVSPTGGRGCRECRNARSREYKQRARSGDRR